jgi:hypothetical protein
LPLAEGRRAFLDRTLANRGRRLVRLTTRQSHWLLRRAIHITFDDALTLRKESTLDISLTRLFWPDDKWKPIRLPTLGSRVLIPITSFPRGEHYDVTVTDANGETLPFLPRSNERMLLAAGYAQISIENEGVFAASPQARQGRYEQLLDLLQQDPPPPEQRLSLPKGLDAWMYRLSGLEFFLSNYLIIATPSSDAVFGRMRGVSTEPSLFRLIECHSESIPGDPYALFEAQELRRYVSEGAILKWATSSSNPRVVTNTPIWEKSLSYDDYVLEIPIREMTAKSVHVNVHVPEGTFIDNGFLSVATEVDDETTEIYQVADDDVHWSAAHFLWTPRFLEGSGEANDSFVILDSRVLLILRPMYHGSLRAPTYLAATSWGTLVVLTFTIGWASAHLPAFVHLSLGSSPDDPVTVLLLGALTVALGVMIRLDEHLMSRSVADRFRGRLGFIAFAMFVGTLAIAVGLQGKVLVGVLAASWIVSFPSLFGLIKQARYSRDRGAVKPRPIAPT